MPISTRTYVVNCASKSIRKEYDSLLQPANEFSTVWNSKTEIIEMDFAAAARRFTALRLEAEHKR